MSIPPVPLFVNPVAGRGRAGKRARQIIALLAQAGIEAEVQESTAVGDLEQRVYHSCVAGARRLIVAGGDGSVHEAVNGILHAGSPTRFGVVPTGTGNDFAKACGIDVDWQSATRSLAQRMQSDAPGKRIDIGRMNDRYFANGAGIGFDAKVTKIARSFRWPIGDLVYLLAIFRCMLDGIATPTITITSDAFDWHGPVTLVSISNGAWIGGMFHIAPMARNDDSQLELLVAGPVSRTRILTLLPKLIRGQHMNEREISHAAVRRLRIDAAAPVPSHLDGEVGAEATSYDVELVSAALQLL